jgi:predicted RNA-binding Zn ribbon-like protein
LVNGFMVQKPSAEASGSRAAPPTFDWIGGTMGLDFLNTAWGDDKRDGDRLPSFRALLQWLDEARVITRADAAEARQAARASPRDADQLWKLALRTRQVLHDALSTLAAGDELSTADLGALNALVASALPHLRLTLTESGLSWRAREGDVVSRGLADVVWSAAQLMTSPGEVSRLRSCANERCGRLFLDRSKNGSRRWCDMRDCGNRDKSRRYYARRRAELPFPDSEASQADGMR